MKPIALRLAGGARPRVVLVGSSRDPLKLSADGLPQALHRECDIVRVAANSPYRDGARVLREAGAALTAGAEMLHVLDARFAPAAALIRRRHGIPVGVTVTSSDMNSRTPWARLSRRSFRSFDHAFASEEAALYAMRDSMPLLAGSLLRPAARELPAPGASETNAVAKALRGVRPGRLVLGLVWPDNRNDLRWFRDIVLPQIDAKPVCLLIGAPSRREARLLFRAIGVQSEFRVLPGGFDARRLAAASRCVDAFVSPASLRRGTTDAVTPQTLALAVSGVPVVSDGQAEAAVLAHEQNAFLVDRGDERGFIATLNRLLALPAIQRHFLGEEFARFTLSQWRWDDAAEIYGERFASLVGRPRIPAEYRAA